MPDAVGKSRTRYILAGLVIAHILLNGLTLAVMPTSIGPCNELSDAPMYALIMLGPSQAVLLALWAVLGGGRLLWRVLPAVLGAILYLWWFQRADNEWRTVVLGQICIWGPLLFVARLTGLELVRLSTRRTASRPFQYSIMDMLMWTTALAVVLAVLRALPKDWLTSLHVRGQDANFAVFFGSLALVAGAALYSSLGKGWLLARVSIVPLATGAGVYWMAETIPVLAWYALLLLGSSAAWLVGSLLLVRLAGYSLAWRWRFGRGDFDAAPPDEARQPESTEAAEA
ncbi:MAG: hypothetical protein ABSH20_29895 [Tepidisphaeraceae bacterium]